MLNFTSVMLTKALFWGEGVSCRGATDVFEFSSKNVGDIAAICVSHCPKDKKKSSAKTEVYWHVQEIVVTEMELRNQ